MTDITWKTFDKVSLRVSDAHQQGSEGLDKTTFATPTYVLITFI